MSVTGDLARQLRNNQTMLEPKFRAAFKSLAEILNDAGMVIAMRPYSAKRQARKFQRGKGIVYAEVKRLAGAR